MSDRRPLLLVLVLLAAAAPAAPAGAPSPPPAAEGEALPGTRMTGVAELLASLPLRDDGLRLLTLDRTVRTVLENHLSVRIADERRLISEAEAEEEDARFDVSLFGRAMRGIGRDKHRR